MLAQVIIHLHVLLTGKIYINACTVKFLNLPQHQKIFCALKIVFFFYPAANIKQMSLAGTKVGGIPYFFK